jgi:DNA-binding transcriptional ArsR family regulator
METQTFENPFVVHDGIVKPANLNYAATKKAALILRSINHKMRQQIIAILAEKKKMAVTDIYVKLRIEQSVASQNLGMLRNQQIVVATRIGREVFYSVNNARIAKIASSLNQMTEAPSAGN